ncbi:MAG TPA: hypothetical protein VGP04_15860 [Pseudonocardiaceae bacterium]|nr:hypothetical protein [Pseudonocardiaceae bacterium]
MPDGGADVPSPHGDDTEAMATNLPCPHNEPITDVSSVVDDIVVPP